jgi:hypothetical protein
VLATERTIHPTEPSKAAESAFFTRLLARRVAGSVLAAVKRRVENLRYN